MRELIKVFKAVADKNRMRVLKMLERKTMCVCEIAAVLGITQPSASKHLSILKDAGLISDKRNGQWIDYSLSEEKVNIYAPVMQAVIKGWENEDPVVENDRKKMMTLVREELCKK